MLSRFKGRRLIPRPDPAKWPARRSFNAVEPLENRVLMSTVAARHVFYNASAFDGWNPAANAADDAAVATDKSALLPGQKATFANYTTSANGINGVMVDLAGAIGAVGADDFELRVGRSDPVAGWNLLPAAPTVSVRPGAGTGASNRVTLAWNGGQVRNQWLSVTVKANADTGLAQPDVFYFGNLAGDVVTAGDTSTAMVDNGDFLAARRRRVGPAAVTDTADFNRDGMVTAVDVMLSRRAFRRTLSLITPAAPGGGGVSFFVPVELQGETPVTIHPIESVAPGQPVRVTFGVPFPKGFVPAADLSQVRLLDAGGAERPVYVELLSPWRDLATGFSLPSARSVMVQTDVTFPDADSDGDADPVAMRVEWGRTARTVMGVAEMPVRQNWVQYNNAAAPAGTDYKTADNVFEPPAYALFTPEWYGEAVIKTRLLPDGSDPSFAFYDTAYKNFGTTAVNDVDPRVTAANLLKVTTDSEVWLFDRATALYQLGFRTGSLLYIREGHRAAQFYANHINASGYFDLKNGDIKYVYGEAIATDYWLTGDDRLLPVHQREIRVFDSDFTAAYNGQFWTERHAAYKLLGYVTGFELLGDPGLATRARDTFTAYVNHQNNPPAGAANTGMLMHSSEDHGEGGSEMIASPWMSVLLVDAVERYYIHSNDARVPQFVTRMADGINRIGDSMYYTTEVDGVSRLVPFYLAGPGLTLDQHAQDSWSDLEHAVDVSKVFALAYYFTRAAGTPNPAYLGRFNELQQSSAAAFQYWTRPGGPSSGLSVYRLNPPRKFNWWFRTTANRDFLIGTVV